MSDSSSSNPSDASSEPSLYEWTDWPAQRNPRWTGFLVAVVMLVSLVVAWRLQSSACGILAMVLLGVTLLNQLLPVHYAITADGLSIYGMGIPGLGSRAQIRWSRIDAARLGEKHAELVLMRDHGSRRREFRVPYGENPNATRAGLRHCLLEAGAPLV